MSGPEFSRIVRVDEVRGGMAKDIEANAAERAALSERLGLVNIESLSAQFDLSKRAEGIAVTGRVKGDAVASCVVSAEDVPQAVAEDVELMLAEGVSEVPTEEEIELGDVDLDRLPLEGGRIDLGELAAMTFALALDPYPRADEATLAEARQHLVSEEEAAAQEDADKRAASPFGALKKS